MANLIKQKFLEGIDSSKFKIEQGGAIKAVNGSGQLVDVFKFDTTSNVVKVYGDEEVAVKSYTDSLMSQEVQNRNSAIDAAITALINGAPQALDTLKELADKLGDDESAISSLISQLAQEVSDREAAVLAEQQARISSDNSIRSDFGTALDQEINDRQTADSAESQARIAADNSIRSDFGTALDQEINDREVADVAESQARIAADNSIRSDFGTALDQEINDRQTADSAEQQARIAADNSIRSDFGIALDQEINDRQTADASESQARIAGDNSVRSDLTAALDQEISDRESAVSSEAQARIAGDNSVRSDLTSALNQEVSDRESADQSLQSQIDSLDGYAQEVRSDLDQEVLDRTSADASLQSQINNILSNSDPVALDSLSEIVTAFQNADSNLNNAITALGTGSQSALNQEILDRQSADTALGLRVDGVVSDLSQEVSDRQAAVSSEESRAMGVEASLQSQLTQEVSDRQTAVSTEETRAMGVEASLQSQLTQEISDRQSAVSVEEAARIAEDETMFKKDGSRAMTGSVDMDHHSIENAMMVTVNSVYSDSSSILGNDSLYISANSGNGIGTYGFDGVGVQYKENGTTILSTSVNPNYVQLSSNDYKTLEATSNHVSLNAPNQVNHLTDLTDSNGNPFSADQFYSKTSTLDSNGLVLEYGISAVNQPSGDLAIIPSYAQINIGFEAPTQPDRNATPVISSANIREDAFWGETEYWGSNDLVIRPGRAMDSMGNKQQLGVFIEEMHQVYDDNGNGSNLLGFTRINYLNLNPRYGFKHRMMNVAGDMINGMDLNGTGLHFYGDENLGSWTDYGGIQARKGSLSLDGQNPFLATNPSDITTKAYVDAQVTGGKTFSKESFLIDTESEFTSVTLSHVAVDNSMVVTVNRLSLHEGMDYSVSVVDGVTVVTWMGDFAVGGIEAIEEGDVIHVTYMY